MLVKSKCQPQLIGDPKSVIAGWCARPAATSNPRLNAFTVDVEDYFQVEAFFGVIDRQKWDRFERRVEANTDVILQLLADAGARATFFTLGWIAERHPGIIRSIIGMGHELASHGSDHYRADSQTRAEFFSDVKRAKDVLEQLGGCEVKGYRAPSFSVSRQNLGPWRALPKLDTLTVQVPIQSSMITTEFQKALAFPFILCPATISWKSQSPQSGFLDGTGPVGEAAIFGCCLMPSQKWP